MNIMSVADPSSSSGIRKGIESSLLSLSLQSLSLGYLESGKELKVQLLSRLPEGKVLTGIRKGIERSIHRVVPPERLDLPGIRKGIESILRKPLRIIKNHSTGIRKGIERQNSHQHQHSYQQPLESGKELKVHLSRLGLASRRSGIWNPERN